MTNTIADNIKLVQDNIAAACARANRSPEDITLVAVSKRKPVSDVLEALGAGLQHFGENRVEEIAEKAPTVAEQLGDLPEPIWHMVGHIQSRKAKEVVPLFSVVHSIDSIKLAKKLAQLAEESSTQLDTFIQVNVAGEEQKYGFDGANWRNDTQQRESLLKDIRTITGLKSLNVRGLMTMAPYGAPDAELRSVFVSLAALKAEVESTLSITLPDLSMGMTDDYPIAIEEGATVIRVGRAIFGERQY